MRAPSSQRIPSQVLVIAAIALTVVVAVLWSTTLRYRVFPKNFGVVEEDVLYRSGYLTPPMLRRVIREHGIRTVVDLGGSDKHPQRNAAERAVADDLGIARIEVRLSGDGTGDPDLYATALRVMADPANQPVLVHCAAGSQRTTVAVALFEHLVLDRPVVNSLRESIERHRHDPEDNPIAVSYLVENIDLIRTMYEGTRPDEATGETAPEAASASDL
jgi:protein tyrosine phosphatase (PTP) superfamily phosphohydrolase (DUF442 family)